MSLWDELGGVAALIFGRISGGDEKEIAVDADGHVQVDVLSTTGNSAVTVADGADVAEGATTDAAVVTDTTGTVSGKLRGLVKWAFERMPASLGQKAKAASLPVTLASDEDLLGRLGEVQAAPTANTVLARLKELLTGIVLAAGTNIVGKVGIDQTTPGATNRVDIGAALPAGTNNIGDVDVLSVPAALQGPGNPTVDSYASAAVDLAASTANQVLVASPGADKQIWVYGLFMMADTAAGTVTLQDEDDAALSGTMAVSDEGGWVLPPSGNFAMPWIKVATNKALEADTGACTVDGIITYAIVDVS